MTGHQADSLFECLPGELFRVGEKLAEYTTIKVGGPARLYYSVRDEREVALLLKEAKDKGIPVLVMGNGSNLLISDAGFEGLVIHFGSSFAQISLEGTTMVAQAGAPLMGLSRLAMENGLTGLEFASGIPASMGGAALMNAGAYGGEMSQVITRLDCLDRSGKPLSLSGQDFQYGYRTSRMMKEGLIVVRATLELQPGDPEAIRALVRDYTERRRSKQPLTYPSAGSFFKRPPGYFAGALIEQCGLKGLKVGGAEVSGLHCGFLINTGGATASDFVHLASLVQRHVRQQFGVSLEPEVRVIGDQPLDIVGSGS